MSKSNVLKSALSIRLDEFVEVTTKAVLLAMDSRAKLVDDRFPRSPDVTIGIVIRPRDQDDFPFGGSSNQGLSISDFDFLTMQDGLNSTSVGVLKDKLNKDLTTTKRFIFSIGKDFSSTMEKLFKLNQKEKRAIKNLSDEDLTDITGGMKFMLNSLENIIQNDNFDMDLDFAVKPSGKPLQRPKGSLEVGGECKTVPGQSRPSYSGTIKIKVTF